MGDAVSAVVKSLDLKNKKIRLSIKDYEGHTGSDRSVTQYLNNKENVSSSLGKALADMKLVNTDN